MSVITETKRIEIDARGPRFSAALTTIVLAIALVTGSLWVATFKQSYLQLVQLKAHSSLRMRLCIAQSLSLV